MNTDRAWSASQRALLNFLRREELLATLPEPPGGDGATADDCLFTSLADVVDQGTIARLLAERLRLATVEAGDIDPGAEAVTLVEASLARRYGLAPVTARADTIEIAIANPFDTDAVKAVEFSTGRRVRMRVATHSAVAEAIARLYGGEASAVPASPAPVASPMPVDSPSPTAAPAPAREEVDGVRPESACVAAAADESPVGDDGNERAGGAAPAVDADEAGIVILAATGVGEAADDYAADDHDPEVDALCAALEAADVDVRTAATPLAEQHADDVDAVAMPSWDAGVWGVGDPAPVEPAMPASAGPEAVGARAADDPASGAAGSAGTVTTRTDRPLGEPRPSVAVLGDPRLDRLEVAERSAARDVAEIVADVKGLRAQVAALGVRVDGTVATLARHGGELGHVRAELERLDGTLRSLTGDVGGLRTETTRRIAVIEKAAVQGDRLECALAAAQSNIAKLYESHAELRAERSRQAAENDARMEAVAARVAAIVVQVETFAVEPARLRREADERAEVVRAATARIESLERIVKEARAVVARVDALCNETARADADLGARVDAMMPAVAAEIAAARDALGTRLVGVETSLGSLARDAESARTDRAHGETEHARAMAGLRAQLAGLATSGGGLDERLARLERAAAAPGLPMRVAGLVRSLAWAATVEIFRVVRAAGALGSRG